MLPSHDEVVAERCRRSLSRFVREAWPLVEPVEPFVASWHIDVVSEHLEAVTAGEIRRLIINVPPRSMKSLSAAVFWPAWEWLSAPHRRWLFASYAADLSTRDSTKCRRLIESWGGRQDGTLLQRVGYQGLLALIDDDPWHLAGDQNAKTRYETSATGLRLATSVGAMVTGEGGDRIVVDDPLNPKQARSDAERSAANMWWDETMSSRFNNARSAAVIVMQRLHEQDLTGHLLEKGGWEHLCLPAEYEPSHPFVWPDDPRTTEGELLDRERLSHEVLAERLRDQGSYAYAGQYQQRPAPAEGGMFKRHWWKRWHIAPLELRNPLFERVITSWDMRFSDHDKASSSYVVGQTWACIGADRYLLAQIRARLGFTSTVKAVEALALFNADPQPDLFQAMPSAHLVERKANGAAVIDTLRSKIPGLIPVEPEGGKDVRAAAVEPQAEAGNVWLPAGEFIPAPVGYDPTPVSEWIEELAVFPNGSHDDQVDAFSQALNYLRGWGLFELPDEETEQPVPDLDRFGGWEDGRPRGGSLTAGLLDEQM